MAPVWGKFALLGGTDPFTLAALRTAAAAGILWLFYLVFWRRFLIVHRAGLIGCVALGVINGVGSLFYYNGLHYLDASVAQLLNATYLVFVMALTAANGGQVGARTVVRAALALIAVVLITQGLTGNYSWLGVGLMIANALCFAGTVLLSQRVLYHVPAKTVAVYVLTTMAVVVGIARVFYPEPVAVGSSAAVWATLGLGLTTALARLAMFASVKRLGSVQTVLIGILEVGVALLLAFVLLGEALSLMQWAGVLCFLASVLLARPRDLQETQGREMTKVSTNEMRAIGPGT
jgi:drug/metabolite transporter (DMT)-like permease